MSNVIAAGNVQIGMNANGLYAEAKRVKAEMAAMKKVVRETASPQQELAQKQGLLVKAFKAGQINASDLAQRIEALRAKYGQLNAGQVAAKQSADRLTAAKKRLADAAESAKRSLDNENRALTENYLRQSKVSAATMAAVAAKHSRSGGSDLMGAVGLGGLTSKAGIYGMVATGIGAISIKSIQLAADAERANTSFSVLLGTMERAKSLTAEMRAFSSANPVKLNVLQDSARVMLQFGVSGEKIMPVLKQIGDITGGDSDRFQMLTLAFAQMSAAGRLMGQDLLQMVNAGFNPLQKISKQTGISIADLRKKMEDGAISAKMVEEAFAMAANGMLEAQKATTYGGWNQLTSRLSQIGTYIGETLEPVTKTWLAAMNFGLSYAVDYAKKLSEPFKLLSSYMFSVEAQTAESLSTSKVNQTNSAMMSLLDTNKKITAEKEKQVKLSSQLFDRYDSAKDSNIRKIEGFQFTELEANFRERIREGMSETMAENLRNQEQLINKLEREKKLREDQLDAAKKLTEEGKELSEKYMNPQERARKEIASLMKLLQVGAIDRQTFNRAGMEAMKNGRGDKKEVSNIANTVTSGTQEAYKLLLSRSKEKDEQKKILEDQRRLQQEMIFLQRQQIVATRESKIGAFR